MGPRLLESAGNRFWPRIYFRHDAGSARIAQEGPCFTRQRRADLAGNLIDSLDDTVDEDAEAAWQAEIVRRLEEVRSGKVKTTSWDDVRRKGRALLDGQ
jgi:putative addiction module component (TIGR02574 family)